MRFPPLLFATLAVPAVLPAQQLRVLSKPDVEYPEPFTSLRGVRELGDGRVIAVDIRDKSVQLIDLARGTATKVGREGSGPGEYALPSGILALPGDSAAVLDMLNSRSLVILPNGKPGGFLMQEQTTTRGPGGGMMMMSMAPPRFTDARGRFYSAAGGMRMGPDGPISSDSAPIIRQDRSTKRADTVAYIRLPRGNAQISGGAKNMQVRVGGANPYVPRDEWAVTPDGRIVVFRAPEYRVDWVGGPSATIPYSKIKLSQKHKDRLKEMNRNNVGIARTMQNGRSETRVVPVPPPEYSEWPEYLPPFTANAAFPAPDGRVWLARTREANDETPTYDVIDGTAKVVFRVTLPQKTTVLGFGKGVVYTVRTDEDDLQYLQRFKLP